MDARVADRRAEIVAALRSAKATFAYVFGSRIGGDPRPDSDIDVAAFWGDDVPDGSWGAGPTIPTGVDLVVLDTSPLEIAGRVALHGELLFEDDPALRVEWEATTRKIYLDEKWRSEQATADFKAGVTRGRS